MAGRAVQFVTDNEAAVDKILLINGMWRAGTTYVWSKVRENREWRCYYEPLHESLSVYNPAMNAEWQRTKAWSQMRHPEMTEGYFEEYPVSPSGAGVPLFRESFCYERFVLSAEDTDADLAAYFRSLVRHAENCGQRVCFQPNRLFLRSQWFRSVFPTFHVYVSRDWWDIWRSMNTYPNRYFPSRFYLLASLNSSHPLFQPLLSGKSLRVPETLAYTGAEPLLEPWFAEQGEAFRYFYYVYVCTSIINASCAEVLLDMSAGEGETNHRAVAQARLAGQGVAVDLSDMRTPSYRRDGEYAQLEGVARDVEDVIRAELPALRIPGAKIPGHLPVVSTLRQLLQRFKG